MLEMISLVINYHLEKRKFNFFLALHFEYINLNLFTELFVSWRLIKSYNGRDLQLS